MKGSNRLIVGAACAMAVLGAALYIGAGPLIAGSSLCILACAAFGLGLHFQARQGGVIYGIAGVAACVALLVCSAIVVTRSTSTPGGVWPAIWEAESEVAGAALAAAIPKPGPGPVELVCWKGRCDRTIDGQKLPPSYEFETWRVEPGWTPNELPAVAQSAVAQFDLAVDEPTSLHELISSTARLGRRTFLVKWDGERWRAWVEDDALADFAPQQFARAVAGDLVYAGFDWSEVQRREQVRAAWSR